jgi:hypothetical protein
MNSILADIRYLLQKHRKKCSFGKCYDFGKQVYGQLQQFTLEKPEKILKFTNGNGLFNIDMFFNNNYFENNIFYDNIKYDNYIELDQHWINNINKYIYNLSKRDIYTIYLYTSENGYRKIRGFYIDEKDFIESVKKILIDIYNKRIPNFIYQIIDYVITNTEYLKDDKELKNLTKEYNLTKELYFKIMPIIVKNTKEFTSDIWKIIINKYLDELDNIILKAPATIDDIRTFKGTNDFLKFDSTNKLNNFNSTSFNFTNSEVFINEDNKCCMYSILIKKGSHVLPLYLISSNETQREILINRNSSYKIIDTIENFKYSCNTHPDKMNKTLSKPVDIIKTNINIELLI